VARHILKQRFPRQLVTLMLQERASLVSTRESRKGEATRSQRLTHLVHAKPHLVRICFARDLCLASEKFREQPAASVRCERFVHAPKKRGRREEEP
jgi:hypothetical protein